MKSKLFIFIIFTHTILNANVNVVCKAGIMDNDSAKTYINKLLKKEPKNIECILKLANIHLKNGELLKGYQLISRAYKTNQKAVEDSDIASIVPYALKMTELSKKAKKDKNKLLWNEVGDNFFEMGVFSEAIEVYENSLDLDEDQMQIRLKLALSYSKNNNPDEAVNQLFILIEQNDKYFYANYYLGKILRYSINDEDSAVKFFKDAKNILSKTKKDYTQTEFVTLMNDINRELGK
jgi:tetratricopeptide (TPR) repeat protein